MAASLVDVQNIVNLTGGIPGISGPTNSIQNYNGSISTNSCLMRPRLASRQTFIDELERQVPYEDNGYCFIYYSGHGSTKGNLVLSAGNVVTPNEIFEVSKNLNLPFLIIVDMCHAGKFGEEYKRLARENNWKGIVLCSSNPDEESFEHRRMSEVQFNNSPIIVRGIMKPNLSLGQGIFSAAFVVALNQLGSRNNFTFQELVNKINSIMSEIRHSIKDDELREQTACYYK
jgi:hypothetical protein